ncbi:hypothetical protein [Falsirhodobacter halotolerans]|uniref:hypothetical protein n=1 Tax=Falsirhodobacter halotolerans TaxID=1146892 RepID=UPI001FD0C863|nr:hypothetical protein [Falsirhodobacter halotolerans]MCJ8138617.1 hypothetical protein [Falsirhodobacter halotolerans]
MATLGVIRRGVVVNAIVADDATPDRADWVALPDGVWIGWLFDGVSFTDPNPPPPEDDDV